MLANFEYQLSRDQWASGLRVAALSFAAQNPRRWRWSLAYLTLIISAIAIASLLKPGSLDGVLIALAILWIGFCTIQARWARNWRERSFEPDTAGRTVTLDADGIIERNGLGEGRWSWSGVRRVYDRPDAVMLQVPGWHIITLPNRLWPELNGRAEFIQLVRDRAANLLPDVNSFALSTDSAAKLLSVGAIAAGFDAFVLACIFQGRLFCTCTMWRVLGHNYVLYEAVWIAIPFIAGAAAWKLAQICLKLLRRRYPALASALARLFIFGLFVALLAGPLREIVMTRRSG